jgi:uncharacterized protein
VSVAETGPVSGVDEGAGSATAAIGRLARLPGVLAVGSIRLYQRFISPMTPPTCRFYPSCSQYAVTAVKRHGLIRGGWLATQRLGRCHPWTVGGVDDVPPATSRTTLARLDGPDRARSSPR